jgi:hypothetical protein
MGVGYFDLAHSNTRRGVPPNNIELHPVSKFSYPTVRRFPA